MNKTSPTSQIQCALRVLDDDGEVRRLQGEQLSAVLTQLPLVAVIGLLYAGALGYWLQDVVSPRFVGVWMLAKVLSSMPALLIGLLYRSPSRQRLALQLASGLGGYILVDGLMWGMVGATARAAPVPALVAITTALLCVAAIGGFGLQIRTFWSTSFVALVLAPLCVALLARGDVVGWWLAACTVGLLIGVIGVSQILGRRLLREQLARRRAARVLSLLGDELRTPVSGILGLTRLLRDLQPSTQGSKYLSLIETTGASLLNLSAALMDASQIEGGNLHLHLTEFDLVALVNDLTREYASKAKAKGLAFAAHVDVGAANLRVEGDEARLRQVLNRLLSNALRYTIAGQVDLHCTRVPGSPVVQFKVTDTGAGIAPHELPHLFMAFGREEDGFVPQPAAGLSLSIAKFIARLMGGDLTVRSEPERGSMFELNVSLTPTASPSAALK